MQTLANLIQRPDTAATTSTAHFERGLIDESRFAAAMTMPLGSNAEGYSKLSTLHAQTLLLDRRSEVTSLGCYLSSSAETHAGTSQSTSRIQEHKLKESMGTLELERHICTTLAWLLMADVKS